MRRSLFISVVFAGLIALGSASSAAAVDEGGSAAPSSSPTSTAYTPSDPGEPTLANSAVVPMCVHDVPWINYTVTLVDPSEVSTGHTAYLDLTDGTNSVSLRLGDVASNGTISGRVLWPGASVGADGVGTGWPGWALVDGTWVETSGNYAWTRGAIRGTLRVNPELAVAISYPPATAQCASAPSLSASRASVTGSVASVTTGLPATGGDSSALVWPALGGAVLLGGGILIAARSARSKVRGR